MGHSQNLNAPRWFHPDLHMEKEIGLSHLTAITLEEILHKSLKYGHSVARVCPFHHFNVPAVKIRIAYVVFTIVFTQEIIPASLYAFLQTSSPLFLGDGENCVL